MKLPGLRLVKKKYGRYIKEVDTIAHDELVIEHYGVKGMKWGVRRYKQERAKATVHEKNHMVEKRRLDKNIGTADIQKKLVDRSKSYSKHAKKFAKKHPNSKISKGVETLANKNLAWNIGNLKVTNEKIRESKAIVRKEKSAYNKALKSASKMPVGHYGGKVASYVKPFIRDMVLSHIDSTYRPRLEKTANDRFDENVMRLRKGTPSKIRMRE